MELTSYYTPTNDDYVFAEEDDFGFVYSSDKTKLLACTNADIVEYQVKEGTQIICENTFFMGEWCDNGLLIERIHLPNSLKVIDMSAFTNLPKLSYINIPRNVEIIKPTAFSGICSKLDVDVQSPYFRFVDGMLIDVRENLLLAYLGNDSVLEIPKDITSIAYAAFAGNKFLRNVTIPNTVMRIDAFAFCSCQLLETVTFENDSPLTELESSLFFQCPSLQKVILPDSVAKILSSVFQGCSSLKEVKLPRSLRAIDDLVFASCESLEHLEIPERVRSIGSHAFSLCTSLEKLTLPTSLETIGECAFTNCNALENVNLPYSLYQVGGGVFRGCMQLHVTSQSERFVVEDDMLIDKAEKTLLSYIGIDRYVKVPKKIERIASFAFADPSNYLDKIELPETLLYIGESAFEDSEIFTMTIPYHVKELPNSVFKNCKRLCEVNIDGDLTAIGNEAFSGCSAMKFFTIPETVKTIGDNAFYWCHQLIRIDIPPSVKRIGVEAFSNCSRLTELILPDSVESLGDGAFSQCLHLEKIRLSAKLFELGPETFSECEELKEIIVPSGYEQKFKMMVGTELAGLVKS